METYFKVVLQNGVTLYFNRQCNQVEYNDNTVCKFVHTNEDGKSYRTLAIIPYSSILYILNAED